MVLFILQLIMLPKKPRLWPFLKHGKLGFTAEMPWERLSAVINVGNCMWPLLQLRRVFVLSFFSGLCL